MIFDRRSDGRYWLVLEKEEKIHETLTQFVAEQKIQGGFITGIGALKNVEIGFYDLENKTYLRETFAEGDYELISLNGNITLKEEMPYIHSHVILGKRDFSTFGGHLFEAIVAVTAEISLIPYGKMPRREMNDSLGL